MEGEDLGKKPTLTYRPCWRGCGYGLLNDREFAEVPQPGAGWNTCWGPRKAGNQPSGMLVKLTF